MKNNFVRILVVMLVLVCIVSMFAACSDSSNPNDSSKQKEWDIIGIHPALRGDGMTIEYYMVTAVDNDNNIHAVSIQPHQVKVIEKGNPKLEENHLYITIDDFAAFINNQKTSVEIND